MPVPGVGPTPPTPYQLIERRRRSTRDQIAVFVVAALAAIVLWFVIRHTRAGLEMRAVVDREHLAGLRGVNAARTSARRVGDDDDARRPRRRADRAAVPAAGHASRSSSSARWPRSCSAVCDRSRSRSRAGCCSASCRTSSPGYSDDFLPELAEPTSSGLQSAVPYILVILLLLVSVATASRRAGSVADERPPPDHRDGLPTWRRRLPWAIFTFALVAFSLQWLDVPGLAAGRHLRPDGDRAEPGDGDHLPVVRRRHRHGRHGEPRAGDASSPRAGSPAGWALNHDWGIDIPGIAAHGQINFFWALVIGDDRRGRARRAVRVAAAAARRRQRSRSARWRSRSSFVLRPFRPTSSATGQRVDDPYAHARHPRPELDQRPPRSKGDQPKLDLSQLQDQILVFLVLFGAHHARHPRAAALGVGTRHARGAQLGGRGGGVGRPRQPVEDPDLRRSRPRIAGFGGALLGMLQLQLHQHDRAAVRRALLARARGDVRHPETGGALLAGFALAARPAVFHWIATWICSAVARSPR